MLLQEIRHKAIHTSLRGLYLFAVLFCFSGTVVKAQFIQQLRLDPVQPVDNLPVKVIADLYFPNSGCPLDSLSVSQPASNRFVGYALHCVGLLTTICNTSDTFDLGVLPAGSYRFLLREEYGWLPSPCTAGTQPPAIDSIDFQVTVSSGAVEFPKPAVALFPNPAPDGLFTIRIDPQPQGAVCRILDMGGRLLQTIPVDSPTPQIDLTACANGIYLLELWQGGAPLSRMKLVKQ